MDFEYSDRSKELVEKLTGDTPRLEVGNTRSRIESALRAKGHLK